MILENLIQIIKNKSSNVYFANVEEGVELTYQDLERLSASIAELLNSIVRKGDYVAMMVSSPTLYIPTLLACWRLGVVPAILEPYLSYDRYQHFTSSFKSEVQENIFEI